MKGRGKAMTRRIVIEIGAEDSPNTLVNDLTNVVMEHIDGNVEFTICHKILPEKIPTGIHVPEFFGERKG